jgi:3',5'-cyclic AMP phosphodiesterase CpdA
MRIAIVSDIHGNRSAFAAVLADLKQTSPDLILHGGELADSGASPAEIVDRIRELGWAGVVGNTDEMLFAPESLQEFAKQSPGLQPEVAVVEEIAAATRESPRRCKARLAARTAARADAWSDDFATRESRKPLACPFTGSGRC